MTDLNIEKSNEELLKLSARERIMFGVREFGDKAILLSSMQKTASVLMHLFHTLGLKNEILFVDTGYHFKETLQLRDRFMRDYKLNIVTLYPFETPEQQEERYGAKLYKTVEGQPVCCDLRKGKPFIDYMVETGKKVVFGGLRKSEGNVRKRTMAISVDPRFGGYKINPIVDWTDEMVEAYLKDNDVPVNELHFRLYPSIGCECCTTPVMMGENPRAGRWRHLRTEDGEGPEYCGINFKEGGGI